MSAKGVKGPVGQEIEVVGILKEPFFHMAACAAESLRRNFPAKIAEPKVLPLLEFAWDEYLQEKKKELRGETWEYPSNVMCFIDNQLIGDEKMLLQWAYDVWDYKDFKPTALYEAITEDFFTKYMKQKQLYSDTCPRTCWNFQCLCTGEKGTSASGLVLTYKDSIFHRLVQNGWLQGGDINGGKGNSGESIYGPVFEDESFAVPHDKRGVLGMVNKGRHSNGSQFYVTLQPAPYLNEKYVAFGQVIEGSEVLRKLEATSTFNERPVVECKIINCGVFKP
ncbi:probable inactive peptidyl-prolyl cis-trans isomerase-like 6 isoform X2 [Hemicordylus capensis]|uniref:probable inactive peptidyl-prolyl cis-trans isomerase-like 6 isoform X2 n=1 Tax=Hemicordylus capensis TaxID=884348 RepID=UPI002304BE54|nr:probable inactive peptidyl-prolyl cis-trans isomerase-like 6 isoform X2 [Hemicordylus capensis]